MASFVIISVCLSAARFARLHRSAGQACIFAAFKSLYSYDKTPVEAVVEATEETSNWKMQKIGFDAAYGHERMSAYLFLPKKGTPPFQTIYDTATILFPAVE